MAKTLIAFFSRADENYFGGAMRYVKIGNTEIVAGIMKELVDADTYKIEMKDPYSPVYMTCIDEAKKDKQNNARPELAGYLDSIDAYDTIVLGYPNYWGTMPMAVFTFLERYDFTGKTILGALARHVCTPTPNFQPMNANFGIMFLEGRFNKKDRKNQYAPQSLAVIKELKDGGQL